MSKINITDNPKYSFETRKDGKVIARYSVGINGENYTTEYVHSSMGNALHGAKERYNNTLRQKFPELETVDIDSRLGAPNREHPSAWRQRVAEAEGPVNIDTAGQSSPGLPNLSIQTESTSGPTQSAPQSSQNLAQQQTKYSK